MRLEDFAAAAAPTDPRPTTGEQRLAFAVLRQALHDAPRPGPAQASAQDLLRDRHGFWWQVAGLTPDPQRSLTP